ncbi:MAG: CPBP family intramembrane glutamic endopeptidase [Candidatus Cybelea sp.]
MGLSLAVFWGLCIVCEAVLLVYDRQSAYLGYGAFAYGAVLWIITRSCIRLDVQSEQRALKAAATGWRLWARVAVVATTLALVIPGRQLLWHSSAVAAIQRFSAPVHLGADSAIPNFVFYALVPGLLLLALGAKPIELGLTAWRKGGTLALLGALVLPAIFTVIWFAKADGSVALLLFFFVRNLLSNGFSEEFLMRGMLFSHLRAFMSKEWGLVTQAFLFGLFHFEAGERPGWGLEAAAVIAMNAPIGYFLGLMALRARSVVFTGLIHATLDMMGEMTRG